MLAWLLGAKPLWEWCSIGDLDKVRALLDVNVNVNGKSSDGGTGLILAVKKHHNSVVDLLLKQPLIDVNWNDNSGYNALAEACFVNNAEALRMLVSHPTMNSLNLWTQTGDFPLMIAVKRGYVECARILVALPGQNLKKKEHWDPQRSLLEVAREKGKPSMIAILEEAMEREAQEGSPLWKMCMQGDLEGVRKALRRGGASVNEVGPDGKTGLILAVCENDFPMVQFLLQQPGINISCRDNHGFTALHRCLMYRGCRTELSSIALLSSASTLNTKDSGARTPLLLALHMGIPERVEALLAVPGVDLNIKDAEGKSCMDLASKMGKEMGKENNISQILYNRLMYIVEERPMVEMCEQGDLEGVRWALEKKRFTVGKVEHGGYGRSDSMFQTALMFAVQNKLNSVVKFLLTEPDFCFTNEANTLTGDSALHCACQEDNVPAISLIARHPSKPNLNTENSRGETPLMVAVKCGSINSVRCLLGLPGVDMETKDEEGRDLMEIARLDGGDCEIVKLINGAKRPSLGKKKKNKKKGKGDNGSQDKNMLSSSQLAEASESQAFQDCKERHVNELQELLRKHEERQNEVVSDNKERLAKQQKENEERLEKMIRENELEVTSMMKEHMEEKKEVTATAVLKPPPAHPSAPECPVCFEEMLPPTRICQCGDGHLICEPCRKVIVPPLCPTCRGELTGRATVMEQYIRTIFKHNSSGT